MDQDREIEKLNLRLAEVIDEVVFVEGQRDHVEKLLREKERENDHVVNLAEALLNYTKALEVSIFPAVERLQGFRDRELDILGNDTLQNHRKLGQLMQHLKRSIPSEARREFQKDKARIVESYPDLDLEDAYVLCVKLVEEKAVLQNHLALSSNALHESSTVDVARLQKDLEKSQDLLKMVKDERDILLKKKNSQSSRDSQEGQARIRELEAKVRALELQVKESQDERANVAARFETIQSALTEAYEEKALLQEEVTSLRECLSKQARPQNISGVDGEKNEIEKDQMLREHSATVARLEQQIAQLKSELNDTNQRSTVVNNTKGTSQLEIANQGLRRQLEELKSRSSRDQDSSRNLDRRILVFENTIDALNSELAAVEGKISLIEDRHAAEKEKLVQEISEERRQYQQEREECDVLVMKMTNELEHLIRENAALRQRIKDPSAQ